VPQHSFEPEHVGAHAEPGHHADRGLGQDRVNAPSLDVAHVDFDVRQRHRAQAVAQRVAGEQERRRVHHQAVELLLFGAVDALDRRGFGMGVENLELVLVGFGVRAQHGVELGGGRLAVDLGLALAEVAHVGALEQQDLRHGAAYVVIEYHLS